MSSEDRQTLCEVPSGKVELVFHVEAGYSTLEFNAECGDVIHLCKAMCCRLRQGFTVLLNDAEIKSQKYKTRPFPQDPQLRVLQRSEDGNSCFYLNQEKSTCKIHGEHPEMCRTYHCSPGGKGFGVKYRDGGWLWTPMGCLQQLGDGTVVDVRELATVNIGSSNPVK